MIYRAIAALMVCLCLLGAFVIGFASSEPWLAPVLLLLAAYWIVYRRARSWR